MTLRSTNYLGYHAGAEALDPAKPWQLILNPVTHHRDGAIGAILDSFATKREAIAAILEIEALAFKDFKEGGAG